MATTEETEQPLEMAMKHVSLSVSKDKTNRGTVHIILEIRDENGNLVKQFSTIHKELMHLVIVSNNLQHFDHIHPELVGKGRFEADTRLPFGGEYTFFSDYQREGLSEEMSVLRQSIDGEPASEQSVDTTVRSRIVEGTKISLRICNSSERFSNSSENEVRAGSEATLQFSLRRSDSDEAIQDLQTYLGAIGHLVIVRQSTANPPVLTRDDYIHVHADSEKEDGRVDFTVCFPGPGAYKMWGEFKRGDRSIVASFGVNVLPAPQP